MLARILLPALGLMQLFSSHLGDASPLDHELVKRADVDCQAIDPTSELDFTDCVAAISNIVSGKTRAEKNQLHWFGPTAAADVRLTTLQWASGT